MIAHIAPTTQRRAGVLLHPTSLPSGDLGPDAHRFIEFLAAAGITVWQMLPIAPTHGDLSPYTALSVHAGNPALISLQWLESKGWLSPEDGPGDDADFRQRRLNEAHAGYLQWATEGDKAAYEQFRAKHDHWLDDYAMFQALRRHHGHRHWLEWPKTLRDGDAAALNKLHGTLAPELEQTRFEQFVFFQQWQALRDHARHHNVLLLGDVPIFVAHDSAEVWRHRDYFTLDKHGVALTVAGVPPDYFSETGQRWGNPHYRWDRMAADGFKWWKQRLATQLDMFDWLRIDHFRGFEAYWEIPAEEETAINGRWVEAPGDELFAVLQQAFDPLPLVAEDLGIITEEVDALRRKYQLPGMKILQFAFDSDAANPYLPHNHTLDSVVYTGTHDNNTTLGWYQSLPESTRGRLADYLGQPEEEMPWQLMRCCLASVARLAILPMQDLLGLDGEHRMNTPGVAEGNWRWRFEWDQLDEGLAQRLRQMVELYGRSL